MSSEPNFQLFCRDCENEGIETPVGFTDQSPAYAYDGHWKCEDHRDAWERFNPQLPEEDVV